MRPDKERRPSLARKLLLASLAVLAAGAVYTGICVTVWPVHAPAWTVRVSSVTYLAGIVLLAAATAAWLWKD